ncbi:DUF5827 family protein [Halococcus thailandensis]|uniref:Uncharacterized protein n=1 Tax=Halococcus thailandensis JCM 13552 TaxID=1227457 RepID=M0NBD7_9EURY|nr:DUF5827 family protein [Halococcus thailandensis]EMA53975.1 hypothetical protein C451_08443 [Halococcus thailandensis JCM 13552]
MPRQKSSFDRLRPFEFREPADVLDPDAMYTVYEIARLLQGLEPDTELDVETEGILLDWAIPWLVTNADELCFGDPESDDEPGHYGLLDTE